MNFRITTTEITILVPGSNVRCLCRRALPHLKGTEVFFFCFCARPTVVHLLHGRDGSDVVDDDEDDDVVDPLEDEGRGRQLNHRASVSSHASASSHHSSGNRNRARFLSFSYDMIEG